MGLSRHQRMKGFEVRGRDGCKNRSVGRSLDGFGTVEDGGFKKAAVEVNVSRLICESREEAQRGATLLVCDFLWCVRALQACRRQGKMPCEGW